MTSARVHPTSGAAERIGCSERWLIEQLRANRFPGRKVGRHWRMTDQDIEGTLDLCRNAHRHAASQFTPVFGLTPRSRKQLTKPADGVSTQPTRAAV
jgi:hypothetical protein